MRFWIVVGIVVLSISEIRADQRVTFTPSLEIVEVNDDNLNYSATEPLRDHVRRITPALGLRYESPRLFARLVGGLDAEQYAKHPGMNDPRAREQALLLTQYQATPRLRLGLNGTYLRTNTLADLNVTTTGLAASRVRGEQMNVGALAAFRVSPRFTVSLQPASTTIMANGITTRTQVQAVILQQKVSERDLFNVHYEYWDSAFRGPLPRNVITQFLVARWIRDFEGHNRVTVLAGPRVTDGKHSIDFTGIVAHSWKRGSIALTAQRNQTLVAGYVGLAESEMLQTKFAWTPNRRLTAYAIPAIFRTTANELQGNVHRIGVGVRYAITPLIDGEVGYKSDDQNGAIDPLQPNARFSHSTLLLRVGMRWNEREGTR
jgi:hypothetical protein